MQSNQDSRNTHVPDFFAREEPYLHNWLCADSHKVGDAVVFAYDKKRESTLIVSKWAVPEFIHKHDRHFAEIGAAVELFCELPRAADRMADSDALKWRKFQQQPTVETLRAQRKKAKKSTKPDLRPVDEGYFYSPAEVSKIETRAEMHKRQAEELRRMVKEMEHKVETCFTLTEYATLRAKHGKGLQLVDYTGRWKTYNAEIRKQPNYFRDLVDDPKELNKFVMDLTGSIVAVRQRARLMRNALAGTDYESADSYDSFRQLSRHYCLGGLYDRLMTGLEKMQEEAHDLPGHIQAALVPTPLLTHTAKVCEFVPPPALSGTEKPMHEGKLIQLSDWRGPAKGPIDAGARRG